MQRHKPTKNQIEQLLEKFRTYRLLPVFKALKDMGYYSTANQFYRDLKELGIYDNGHIIINGQKTLIENRFNKPQSESQFLD